MHKSSLHRMTHQRRVIIEELAKVKTHPTADEVYEMVRTRLPHISLGTVYRNLDVLSKAGAVLKLTSGPQARFDGCTELHYHVKCTGCGRLDDMPHLPEGFEVSSPGKIPCRIGDYEIVDFHVEFLGMCPGCRK